MIVRVRLNVLTTGPWGVSISVLSLLHLFLLFPLLCVPFESTKVLRLKPTRMGVNVCGAYQIIASPPLPGFSSSFFIHPLQYDRCRLALQEIQFPLQLSSLDRGSRRQSGDDFLSDTYQALRNNF